VLDGLAAPMRWIGVTRLGLELAVFAVPDLEPIYYNEAFARTIAHHLNAVGAGAAGSLILGGSSHGADLAVDWAVTANPLVGMLAAKPHLRRFIAVSPTADRVFAGVTRGVSGAGITGADDWARPDAE